MSIIDFLPGSQWLRLGAVVAGLVVAGGIGYRVGVAGSAKQLVALSELVGKERVERAQADRDAALTYLEAARVNAAAEARRRAAAEQRAALALARAREVRRNVPVVDRPDCEWAADERLRLEGQWRAYFGEPDSGSTGRLPGGLSGPAVPEWAPHGVGAGGAGLGIRVPPAGQ